MKLANNYINKFVNNVFFHKDNKNMFELRNLAITGNNLKIKRYIYSNIK